jgi:hypothetical protein
MDLIYCLKDGVDKLVRMCEQPDIPGVKMQVSYTYTGTEAFAMLGLGNRQCLFILCT